MMTTSLHLRVKLNVTRNGRQGKEDSEYITS